MGFYRKFHHENHGPFDSLKDDSTAEIGQFKWATDKTRPRGRQFHTVSCQKLFRTYQFGELRVN